MKKQHQITPVKGGGWIKRDPTSGRFVEVITDNGVAKARPKSFSAVKEASIKRSSALKRLADR
jgi:hypothetical protein